jgi:hypothetical protein
VRVLVWGHQIVTCERKLWLGFLCEGSCFGMPNVSEGVGNLSSRIHLALFGFWDLISAAV